MKLDIDDIELFFHSRMDSNDLDIRSKFSLLRMLRFIEDNIDSFSIAERTRMVRSMSRIIRDNI